MAFIRTKSRGGRRYAYLVENRWEPAVGSPRQRVLAYLGPELAVAPRDVPAAHRDDPAVARWFAQRGAPPSDAARFDALRPRLRVALGRADRRALDALAESATERVHLPAFLEEALAPVMREIGDDWHAGRIGVDEEHVATRAATDFVRRLRERSRPPSREGLRVLLANPEGEQHALALDVLECALARMGHRSVVIGGGAPRRDIAKRAQEIRAQLALVSVTQPEHVPEALELSRAIRERVPDALVGLGGQGWGAKLPRALDPGERLVRATPGALAQLVHEAASHGSVAA